MKSKNMTHDTTEKNSNAKCSDRKNIRILIVEKNPMDAAIAEKLLELLNYKNMVVTNSGKEAIKLFSALRFDMVILGTDLPDINEIEVCHQLRAMYTDKYFPIIAYTSFGNEFKPEILNHNFDDFLFKLAGLEDFSGVIQRCSP
jgi:CheY-like chemotaxis protein